MVQVIKDIRSLRISLYFEPISWFSRTRYFVFFKKKGRFYELAPDKLSQLHLKDTVTVEEAMGQIKKTIQEYNQLPFWRQWWWLMTRPMKLYRGLYELHSLFRLEYFAVNDRKQVIQEYENSLLKPNWFDRLFGTWRFRLYQVVRFIEATPIQPQEEALEAQFYKPKPQPSVWENPFIVAMNKELEKESFSFKRVVDCYKHLDKKLLKEDERKILEKKIWLKIHPNKYSNCPKEIEEVATKQFQRFRKWMERTTHETPYLFEDGYDSYIGEKQDKVFEQWERKERMKKEMDESLARVKAELEVRSIKYNAEIQELKTMLEEMKKKALETSQPEEPSVDELNSSSQFFKP